MPVSYADVEEDCTGGVIMEVVDDSDKVCADVVLLQGCPQSCTSNAVEGLLEVYYKMVEVLLVLEIFVTENSSDENLLCGAPSCSEGCLFFSSVLLCCNFNLFSMTFSMTLLG